MVAGRWDREIIMSMSIMGFAGRWGTDVLPMCSMARMGTARRVVLREAWMVWKVEGHWGLGGSMVMRILGWVGGFGGEGLVYL